MRDLVVAWLVWLSADPVALDVEHPRAAAAVAVARASMATEPPPSPPKPTPQECVCGKTCVNGVWKPDGHISQPCPCKCDRCIKKPSRAGSVPSASPATVSPARP